MSGALFFRQPPEYRVRQPSPAHLPSRLIDRPVALVCLSLAIALAMLAARIAAYW